VGQLTFDDATPPPPRALSVTELVQRASRRLEATFGDVWVEGEVSNLKTPASGHCYFTLKDARAQLPVVMFRMAVSRLEFRVEDGQKLRCRGRVSIYDRQGRFQLTAVTAEPAGVGAHQLAFEQLKQKLEAQGLFDPRHKKPLPALPTTIALVTSRTGAALRDIVRVLHARFPVRVVLSPTPVQGSDAPAEIVRALRRADGLGADLIILGRGGGSLEDLRAFNHEGVARAIFSACTPVISAVGHEVDVTIADLVADRRAPTPSAAAEMAVPEARELADRLQVFRLRLGRSMSHLLRRRELALERLDRRLGSPRARVDRERLSLDEAAGELSASLARVLAGQRERLAELRTRLASQEPRARLTRDRAALSQLERELLVQLTNGLARRRATLDQLLGRLGALSPLGVLDRGYGLVLDVNQNVIRDISTVAEGQRVTVRLAGGELSCVVEEVRGKPEV
jgi:exodeoxyribonuclease VII large subunit